MLFTYVYMSCIQSGLPLVKEKSGNLRICLGNLLKVSEIQEKQGKFKKIYIS